MIFKLFQFGSLEALSRILSWGMMLILPLITTQERYGEVSLFFSLLAIVAALMSLGLDRAILRFHRPKEEQSSVITEVILLETLACLIFFLIALFTPLIDYLIPEIFSGPTIFVLLICAFMKNLLILGVAVGRVEQSQLLLLLLRFAPQFSQVVFVLFVLYFFPSIWIFILAVVLSFALFLIPQIVILARRGQFNFSSLDLHSVKKILLLCWPFLFLSAAGHIHSQIDRVIIAHYINLSELGAYSLFYTFGSGINFIFSLTMFTLEPRVYQVDDEQESLGRIRMIGSLQLALGLGVASLLCLFGSDLLELIYPKTYLTSFSSAIVILAGHVMHPLYLMGNMGLIFKKKTSLLMWGIIPSVIINIGLNCWWVPIAGIYGAALATLISYMTLNAIIWGIFLFQSEERKTAYKNNIEFLTTLLCVPLLAVFLDGFIQASLFALGALYMAYNTWELNKDYSLLRETICKQRVDN